MVDLVALFLNYEHAGHEMDSATEVLGLEVAWTVRRVDQLGKQTALDLVARYKDGLTVSQLAVQFGVNITTVRSHLKAADVELRPFRKLSQIQILEVCQLSSSGASLGALAAQFGVSTGTIKRVLHESRKG